MSFFDALDVFATFTYPNDPLFDQQWALSNGGQFGGTPGVDVNALSAWSIANTSPNVVVAVIDSGIQLDHPDLKDNIWVNEDEIPGNGEDDDGNGYIDDVHGWSYRTKSTYPDIHSDPGVSHGTHVAGIIGATGDNNIGIAGVTWDVQLMPLEASAGFAKIGDASTGIPIFDEDFDYFGKSVRYAVDNGASVINISQGTTVPGQSYEEWKNENPVFHQWRFDALKYAVDNGVTVVFAAGNGDKEIGENNTYEPGYLGEMLDGVINVGATDDTGEPTSYTNWGEFIDITAPGGDGHSDDRRGILSTDKNDQYLSVNGTSQAAPVVTGAIALMLGIDPSLTPAEIERMLKDSAATSQYLLDQGQGDGLILDIASALLMTKEFLEKSASFKLF